MISIIVPVYNALPYIDKTIDMVLRQSYPDFELILVEDGSTDGTREYLQKLCDKSDIDVRIRIVLRGNTIGKAAGARNEGIALARGRYIAFLDADDVWTKDKLKIQLAFMEKEQAAFCFTTYEYGDEEAVGTGRFVIAPNSLSFKEALSRTVIFTSTVMIDTSIIPKDLIYMPHIGSEDTATWWNILKAGFIAKGLDKSLVIYRRPKKSLSSNKLLAIKRIWRLYREIAKLNIISSAFYFIGWAFRATLRRIA